MWKWRPIVFVLLPFSAGYFLSYLFRTINALISAQLTAELGLSAAGLGLLTSVYFLTFAAAQLPIGVSLDYYGPRRIQAGLLLLAAAGAAMFGFSYSFAPLVFARALIGLGVAAALSAGFKALALWFPKQRLALANGCMVMLGALGAVTATAPAELVLGLIGWRGLFELLAIVCAACALITFFVVPEVKPIRLADHALATIGLKAIWTDARFWRLAPFSATCVGTSWGLQGLWAAPWLADVDGLERTAIVQHLFVMALALSAGALAMGIGANRLRARGVRPHYVLAIVAMLSVTVQLALIVRLAIPSQICWALVAAAGAAPVLSYASLAKYFPNQVIGRANGALGVVDIGGAFILQYATGLVIQQWPAPGGHYPATAYQAAFAIMSCCSCLRSAGSFCPMFGSVHRLLLPIFSAALPFVSTMTRGRVRSRTGLRRSGHYELLPPSARQ
jgi:sugar phosphate permease